MNCSNRHPVVEDSWHPKGAVHRVIAVIAHVKVMGAEGEMTQTYIWIILDTFGIIWVMSHKSKVFQVQDGSCWVADSVTGTSKGWDSHGWMALWLGEAELQDAGCCRGLPVAGIWDGMTEPGWICCLVTREVHCKIHAFILIHVLLKAWNHPKSFWDSGELLPSHSHIGVKCRTGHVKTS